LGTRTARKTLVSRPRSRRQLRLESLEERCLMATLTVDPLSLVHGVYHTITAAVSAAHAGDTIDVGPGTYNEAVDVNKPGLTIIGGQPIVTHLFALHGPSLIDANPASTGFTLDAKNVTVKNFTIEQEADGIVTNGAFSGFKILNNTFLDDSVGVHLNTTNTAPAATIVSGNVFTSNGAGVPSQDGILTDVTAWNTTITNNKFQAGDLDASIKNLSTTVSNNVRINGNIFTNDNQIIVAGIENSRINDNTIIIVPDLDNPQGTSFIASGIHLAGQVRGTQVAGNTLLDTTYFEVFGDDNAAEYTYPDGIVVDRALVDNLTAVDSGNTISNNTVNGFADGIYLSNALGGGVILDAQGPNVKPALLIPAGGVSGNTISGNTLTYSQDDGIDLEDAPTSNTISSNTLMHNGQYGLVLSGASQLLAVPAALAPLNVTVSLHNTISKNVVEDNTSGGILLEQAAGNTLSGNIASFNGVYTEVTRGAGIELDGSNQNQLTGNTAISNVFGIQLGNNGSNGNTLSANVANQNFVAGIILNNDSQDNTLSGNRANANFASGFANDTSGTIGNTYTKNTADNNVIDGFVLSGASNTVANNIADGNFRYGFFFDLNSSTIKSNTAADNGAAGMFFSSGGHNTITGNTANFNGAMVGNLIVSNEIVEAPGGVGVFLRDEVSDTLTGNTAADNQTAGILADAESISNTISQNTALGNGSFDLDDASGTTTQNTWSKNIFQTSSPLRLD